MSDLPVIDAKIDQAICMVRKLRESYDQDRGERLLDTILEELPELACLAATYHLGMLTLLRGDCLIEEMENEA